MTSAGDSSQKLGGRSGDDFPFKSNLDKKELEATVILETANPDESLHSPV